MIAREGTLKKIAIFLLPLALALLACRTLIPSEAALPARTALPEATAMPVATSEAEATAFAPGNDFTLVRIYPKDGQLHSLLAAEVKKARALGQMPFVEFDATWCPPCQAITASLAAKNKLMLEAYSGIYLIHADVDQWGWHNPEAGFSFDAIPVFYQLDADGRPGGPPIDGGAWAADIPENIAPVLAKFFHPYRVPHK